MYYRHGTVNITLVKVVTKDANKDIYVCVIGKASLLEDK